MWSLLAPIEQHGSSNPDMSKTSGGHYGGLSYFIFKFMALPQLPGFVQRWDIMRNYNELLMFIGGSNITKMWLPNTNAEWISWLQSVWHHKTCNAEQDRKDLHFHYFTSLYIRLILPCSDLFQGKIQKVVTESKERKIKSKPPRVNFNDPSCSSQSPSQTFPDLIIGPGRTRMDVPHHKNYTKHYQYVIIMVEWQRMSFWDM